MLGLPSESYLKWINEASSSLTSSDGAIVKIFEFNHEEDEELLSSWAKHFRNHYCLDEDIDDDRMSMGLSRSEYLLNIKFPDCSVAPGPSTRAGDFGEILIADYLEYKLNYFVPRTRYENKNIKNESTKGIDVLGFKPINVERISEEDELLTFEVKCALQNTNNNTLAKALKDSKKDFDRRKAEALHAMRRRLKEKGKVDLMKIVERYQDQVARPYKEVSGAAAIHSNHNWSDEVVTTCIANDHPNPQKILIVVKGEKLMDLVHKLYERACNEA